MHEPRNLKLDLLALALLALSIFLAAALVSYDVADPPSSLVYPARQAAVNNICGRSGALAAAGLFAALGLGAYYLVVSLAALDAVLLARKTVDQPWLRLGGWLLSLCGVCTLVAMALPQGSPGPVIGSGGYLGAAGRGFMELNFASVGAYILTCSFVVAGLLLATDYALVNVLKLVVGKPAQNLSRSVAKVGSAYAEKLARKRSDLDDVTFEPAPADNGKFSVKIAGRPEEAAAATETDEAAAADEPAEEAAEETKPAGGVSKLASMLGLVKKPKSEAEEKEKLIEELAESPAAEDSDYELPSIELLLPSEGFSFEDQEKDVRRKAKILEKTFADFGFNVRVVEIQTGPVIAQFEVELEAGLRLSKITSLSDDIAIALRVPSVRIVAPIPGKNTVGVEVPNSQRQIVRMREVMEEANGRAAKMRIPIYLGKDVAGAPMVCDLTSLPHLLIAGRTGTGKSVCLNTIIASMLMTRRPDEVRMLLVDPKMVELSPYKSIPHLMHPVVTDMRKAEAILAWAVEKMEERYHLLARAGVRHISNYNQLGEEELMDRIRPETPEERKQIPLHMPYIVIVADELADLMMTAAKEVEGHIIRLAQKSRAVGIHLVLATQKPTVDVITGLIKSNLPARICFQVASRTDSRVVLDEMGADKLLGNGDMLFLWPGTSTLIRGQGTYLSDDEINQVIGSVSTTEPQFVKELVQLQAATATSDSKQLASRDELYEAAIDCVVREGRGSVSLLQRTLGIGYGRAARLIDFMAEDGIVGNYNGSQAREVLLSVEDWEARGQGGAGAAAASAEPKRTNKIMLSAPRPVAFEEAESDGPATAEDDDVPFVTEQQAAAKEAAIDDAYDEEEEGDVDEEPADQEEDDDWMEDGFDDEASDNEAADDRGETTARRRGCA